MEDIKKIIYENTKHIENKEDRKNSEALIRACYTISKETGIKLEDTINHSYCFVKKRVGDGKLFGKIGVYKRSEGLIDYFKFGRKLIGFDSEKDEVYWVRNVIMLLEEREKIFRLFQ